MFGNPPVYPKPACTLMWPKGSIYTFSLMPVLWKVNTDVHIWRLGCLHSPLTPAGHFAERWRSFAHNQKHSRVERGIMKKHLTPKSVYIPSAAAQEAYKWQLSLGSKLAGLPGQGRLCQRAMTTLWLLFQGRGEERVIGGKRGWGAAALHKKACVITTRWEGFMSSLECNRLLKRPSDYKSKNLTWERLRIKQHSRAYGDFCLCSPHLRHHAWPSQIAKLVITAELSAGGASQTSFHNKKNPVCFMPETP